MRRLYANAHFAGPGIARLYANAANQPAMNSVCQAA